MYNKINNDDKISSLQSNDLYDCGTPTFGIAKCHGIEMNIQDIL
jgi:hypothetical protein